MAKTKPVAMSDDSKWRAESDMRTLAEAEAIRRDPKRLKAAQKCAAEQLDAMQDVAGMTPAKEKDGDEMPRMSKHMPGRRVYG